MHYYYLICLERPQVSSNLKTYLGLIATSFPSQPCSHVFHCILISMKKNPLQNNTYKRHEKVSKQRENKNHWMLKGISVEKILMPIIFLYRSVEDFLIFFFHSALAGTQLLHLTYAKLQLSGEEVLLTY